MKMLNRPTKLIAMVLAVTALAAIWTIWGTNRAEAVIAIIKTTGMFSLTQGQATSAYVVNTWTGDERGIVVQFKVLDSQGNMLAQSERQMVAPGQASNYEYGTGVYIPAGQRMAIRLVLRVEGASRNSNRGTPGPDDFIATQEVYNTGDGRTTVFLPFIEQ
jgi:hypothetical protein